MSLPHHRLILWWLGSKYREQQSSDRVNLRANFLFLELHHFKPQSSGNDHTHDRQRKMSGWDLDQSQTKVMHIWLSIQPRDEANIVNPSHAYTLSPAADTLISYLTAPPGTHAEEYDEFSDRFTDVLLCLIEFCLLQPRSMDWGITVLFQVIKKIPKDAVCELGEGPEGARLDLERFFGNYTDLYTVGGTGPKVGTFPRAKYAVQFSSEEVKERPEDVIEKIKNERKRRWKTMIMQCFAARCHVLETPVHPHNKALDDRLLAFIGFQLDLTKDFWNKVDCIGLLTVLRGSASYLLSTFPEAEREVKKQEWIQGLSGLLSTNGEERDVVDNVDFQIKAHGAVSLHIF